ncbi:MAG: prohead protease/major capsid protein fusion protein [Pseudomonadota bacterium]
MAAKTRRAVMQLNSFDPETGTFSAIAATETPVHRDSFFDGPYREVLSLAPRAVRLDRLSAGRAPILDAHRSGSSRDQLGVITGARIEQKRLVVDGQLSVRDDVKPIAEDIAAGVIRNISIGYLVHASAETKGADGSRIITRTDWEPLEVSIVPVGADSEAHIRSNHTTKGTTMAVRPKPTSRTRRPAGSVRAAPVIDNHQADDDLIYDQEDGPGDDGDDGDLITRNAPAVHSRVAMSPQQVRAARQSAEAFGLSADFANRCIADGMNLTQVREAAQNEAASRAPSRTNPHLSFNGGGGGDAELGQAIQDAIFGRMTGVAPEGRGREHMGRSLLEMGALLLEARGERVSHANRSQLADQIMTRSPGMHSTSDFPNLTLGAGNRLLQERFAAATSPLKLLARKRAAADFRSLTIVKLSETPALLEVREGAEYNYGGRGEAKESYSLKTFGRIFALTRQVLINDDLNAFADVVRDWARSAANREADQLAALLTANSGNGVNLDDGDPLYTTARGNKASSASAIDETNLGLARKAFREFKGLDGKTPLGIAPKHMLVGPAKETEAEKMLTAITAQDTAKVNPFGGKIELHVEPRISGNSWRLFANPSDVAAISYAYLDGLEGPEMFMREGFEVDGTQFKCRLDFGCGAEEWRGTYLNAGS